MKKLIITLTYCLLTCLGANAANYYPSHVDGETFLGTPNAPATLNYKPDDTPPLEDSDHSNRVIVSIIKDYCHNIKITLKQGDPAIFMERYSIKQSPTNLVSSIIYEIYEQCINGGCQDIKIPENGFYLAIIGNLIYGLTLCPKCDECHYNTAKFTDDSLAEAIKRTCHHYLHNSANAQLAIVTREELSCMMNPDPNIG